MKHLKSIAIAILASATLFSCKKDIDTAEQEKPSTIDPNIGDFWTKLTAPVVNEGPTADLYHVSFSLNQKVYVALSAYNQLWEYNPATKSWSKKQNVFNPSGEKVFEKGNSVYFLNAGSKKLKEYNVVTNQWTNKANFPGAAIFVGASSNTSTKGYIMAGTTGAYSHDYTPTTIENWEYDFAANTWTQKANIPSFQGRFNCASFAIGEKIYFGTGISYAPKLNPTFHFEPVINKDWWEFNPANNTWTQKADFAGGTRQDTRGFVIGSEIYLGLGSSGYWKDVKTDLWSYNPVTNSWSQKSSYPPGNDYPPYVTMVGNGTHGYAIYGKLMDFWRYTPPLLLVPNVPPFLQ